MQYDTTKYDDLFHQLWRNYKAKLFSRMTRIDKSETHKFNQVVFRNTKNGIVHTLTLWRPNSVYEGVRLKAISSDDLGVVSTRDKDAYHKLTLVEPYHAYEEELKKYVRYCEQKLTQDILKR